MSALVIGLIAGLAVAAILVFWFLRSICKEKRAIERQVKQVQQVEEDACYEDVEAPTPPLEENVRSSATGRTAKKAVSPPPAPARAPARARVDHMPPSYHELHAAAASAANTSTQKAPIVARSKESEHVYGNDAEDFEGQHEYQTASDPYDAPVRVSRSTERRSGGQRSPSPGEQSRTTSLASSRGRGAPAATVTTARVS